MVLLGALWLAKRYPSPLISVILRGECTVTESPIFLKLCEIKVSLCSNKITNPYDPLFRNTRENRVNIRDDICSFSYSLFCAVFYNVRCGRAVIGVVFLVVTSVVRISLLDFFFVNFVLHIPCFVPYFATYDVAERL